MVNIQDVERATQMAPALAKKLKAAGYKPPLKVYAPVYKEGELSAADSASGQFETYQTLDVAAEAYILQALIKLGTDKNLIERGKIVDVNNKVYLGSV